MKLKFIIILFLTILVLNLVSSLPINQTDIFYDVQTLKPVNNVQEIIYTCSDSSCSSQGTLIHNLNTGNSNSIIFDYPYNSLSTASNPDYYSHFSFAQCYLPKEYKEWIWGKDTALEYDYYMEKGSSCHSPIDSFSITNSNYVNEPIIINMTSNLEADAQSAFENYVFDWFPAGYENYYSIETKIILEIKDEYNNIVYTDSKDVNILMDTSENVEFQWTPINSGNYTAKIRTQITDCQCESSFEESSEKEFVVFKERPKNQCYTLINNLEYNPNFPRQGDIISFNFDKISNYADNNYAKTSIPTEIIYEIYDENNSLIFTKNQVLNSNSNSTILKNTKFNWTATSSGALKLKIIGVSESALCNGLTNFKDIEILNFFVKSPQQHNILFNITDSNKNFVNNASVSISNQQGRTDNLGKINFNLNPGNYNWIVEKNNYITEKGNINLNSNSTINVQLNALINYTSTTIRVIYPDGGQELEGLVNIIWNAINLQGHTLLIDIFYSSDNGINWNLLSENSNNDGVFEWNTKNFNDGNNYLIKVCSENTYTLERICDESNNVFSIDNIKEKIQDKDNDKDKTKLSTISYPLWDCTDWSACINGFQIRNCIDLLNTNTDYNKPIEKRVCENIEKISIEKQEKSFFEYILQNKLIFNLAFLLALLILFIILLAIGKKEIK